MKRLLCALSLAAAACSSTNTGPSLSLADGGTDDGGSSGSSEGGSDNTFEGMACTTYVAEAPACSVDQDCGCGEICIAVVSVTAPYPVMRFCGTACGGDAGDQGCEQWWAQIGGTDSTGVYCYEGVSAHWCIFPNPPADSGTD
jgi:hypothetical protein